MTGEWVKVIVSSLISPVVVLYLKGYMDKFSLDSNQIHKFKFDLNELKISYEKASLEEYELLKKNVQRSYFHVKEIIPNSLSTDIDALFINTFECRSLYEKYRNMIQMRDDSLELLKRTEKMKTTAYEGREKENYEYFNDKILECEREINEYHIKYDKYENRSIEAAKKYIEKYDEVNSLFRKVLCDLSKYPKSLWSKMKELPDTLDVEETCP